MPSIEAVFFDLDETLLDDTTSYNSSIALACQELVPAWPGFDLDHLVETYKTQSQAYWLEIEDRIVRGTLDGQVARLEGWRRTIRASGCKDDSLAQKALAAYSRHRAETYLLFEDVTELLQRLHPRVPLALITNGSSEPQREKVRVTGIEHYFDVILVSGEAGVAKPDPAIFHVALAKLGVSADGTWHVGDNLRNDVEGAQSAGLRAVWINRQRALRTPGDPKPDHEITTLSELLPLLGEA